MKAKTICLGVCLLWVSSAQAEMKTTKHLVTKRAPFVMEAMGVKHAIPGFIQTQSKVTRVADLRSSSVKGALQANADLGNFIRSSGTSFDLYYVVSAQRSYPEGTAEKVLARTSFEKKDIRYNGAYVIKLATPYQGRRYWKIGYGDSERILGNAGILWSFSAFDGLAGKPAPPYWPPLEGRLY